MGQFTLWSHETELPAEAVSASRARDFVAYHLVEHQLFHLVEDVRLVVSELATNAMVHAQTPFTVTLEQDEQAVLLTVHDGSPTPPVPLQPDLLDAGGRGLSIVDLVSRGWGVVEGLHGAKSVWASFAIDQHSGHQVERL
ncbi:MAG: ATP-binding protein [Nocardioidaceae bacterium]